MLDDLYDTWYLSVGVGVVYLLLALINGAKIKSVVEETGCSIRYDRDLQLVRDAINQNMMWAMGVIVSYILVFVTLWYKVATGGLKLSAAGFHFSALALITYVVGRYSKKLERELKNLRVISSDPKICDTYRRWVRQWDEPRFRLPD
jgi:hypothetical protein